MKPTRRVVKGQICRAVVAVAACLWGGSIHGQTRSGQPSQDPLDELKAVHWDAFDAEMVSFSVAGHPAFVVKPRQPRPDGSRPWIWYAPSLSGDDGRWTLPTERHARLVGGLLDEGFYFCGVDVGESYGSPAGRVVFSKFHRLLVDRFGFSQKACLFPVSRGGLMHYNWAPEHPKSVACIGGIYPVCNLKSYPGFDKASAEYGLSREQLEADLAKHNPLDRLGPLAAAGVPLLHLQGDRDTAVPLEANSGELARRYTALGGKMELIVVRGKGHEIAPEFWETPRLAEFFRRHGGR